MRPLNLDVISWFKTTCLRRLIPVICRSAFVFCLLLGAFSGRAQVVIRGTVFNMYRTRPLEAVTVMSSSGRGAYTDSNGNYVINVREEDSLSFSYLGRVTVKFPVREMNRTTGFDIALHVNATELSEVRVAPKNYRMDSLQNRKDYEKAFDFRKPGISLTSPSQGGLGVGLDLDELINVFRFNRTRRMLAFQRRLVEDEEYKFVDHRFTHYIVKKITHLEGKAADSFMVKFRPSYNFTKTSSDYEFYDYIKEAYQEYRVISKPRSESWRKEDQ